MVLETVSERSSVLFRRRTILLGNSHPTETETPTLNTEPSHTVLVINDSQGMAKEITVQLTLAMKDALILYSPTIELAKWILNRRKVDLVVASSILPDGSISKLRPVLERLPRRPAMVVVGDIEITGAKEFTKAGYSFSSTKTLDIPLSRERPDPLRKTISSLGADLRDTLNNPLQQIVTMVFLAQKSGPESEMAQKALATIEETAKKMSSVVNGLEEKISTVIGPLARK